MKLDNKTVAALTLGEKADQIFFDDDLKRFGLRLRRNGDARTSRTYIVQYRVNGQQRRHKIGDADVLSAEQARKAATKILAHIVLGEDPQGDRADQRELDKRSFKTVAAEYLKDRESEVRKRTYTENKRYLTRNYFRDLHHMPIGRIELLDISKALRAIKRSSGAVTANRAGTALAAMCKWGMGHGYLKRNPTVDLVEKYKETPRSRVLSDAELGAVWNACAGDDIYAKIVRLLILTGCRRQEVGGMRWSELDPDSGIWNLPGTRTKNKRPHALPLPAAAWDIITSVPKGDDDLVFGVRGTRGFVDWHTGKATAARLARA